MKNLDIENRLIEYASKIIELANNLPETKSNSILIKQLIRSGTSPALNYGEAQAAESRKDFIHKMSLCLKELRESFVCLKIIQKTNSTNHSPIPDSVTTETNELISIFVKSIKTAKQNSG